MKLNIDNTEYELNTKRAEELGVLTKVQKHFTVGDLKIGDIFKFKDGNGKYNPAMYIKSSNSGCGYTLLYGKLNNSIITECSDPFTRVIPGCSFSLNDTEVAILDIVRGNWNEFRG